MEITSENYFKLKEQKLSRAEIANNLDIPEWKLKRLISANGWGKPASIIEFEDTFSYYDEYSCYWAGFLAADGNVDSKKRVRLMLKYDDITHLEKFKELIGSTHTISSNTDKYNRCSFEFTNTKIWQDLQDNFYIIPNKTNKLKLPEHLGNNMVHYIRGYFDGDGSICESFSNKNSITSSIYATFCSGCVEYANSLFSYLNKELGVQGHNQVFENKNQIKYNTNDAKTLLSWMYKDSNVYLDRKYLLYKRLVEENIRTTRVLDKGIVQSS